MSQETLQAKQKKSASTPTGRRSAARAPIILAIVGEKSSGKSDVFRYLQSCPGIVSLRFSDLINKVLRLLDLDERDRGVQGKMAEILRAGFGGGILVEALIKRALTRRPRLISLEGLRKLNELQAFRRWPRSYALYITAPVELRWRRARARRHYHDDRVSLKQFKWIEKTYPAELEISRVGQKADFRIDNTDTKSELFRQVDGILRRLGYRRR